MIITTLDGERISQDCEIAITSLESIIASRYQLHPDYLKEKVEKAQRCLDFMKSFYKEKE